MNEKEVELIKNECIHLNDHLKLILKETEIQFDDPKKWYDMVSDFLLTKNLLTNLNKKMTDNLGEYFLKPTSLDGVDPDSFSELFRVRVDSNIDKEREELMTSEKDTWISEGGTVEEGLLSLKDRIVTHQQIVQESTQLILEEFEKQKKKFNSKDIFTYDIKNDDLVNQLLSYNGAACEGVGLTQYVAVAEKQIVKPKAAPQQIPGRVKSNVKDDEAIQKQLFEESAQRLRQQQQQQQKAVKAEPNYQQQQQQQQIQHQQQQQQIQHQQQPQQLQQPNMKRKIENITK
jgi:hypothetical protein